MDANLPGAKTLAAWPRSVDSPLWAPRRLPGRLFYTTTRREHYDAQIALRSCKLRCAGLPLAQGSTTPPTAKMGPSPKQNFLIIPSVYREFYPKCAQKWPFLVDRSFKTRKVLFASFEISIPHENLDPSHVCVVGCRAQRKPRCGIKCIWSKAALALIGTTTKRNTFCWALLCSEYTLSGDCCRHITIYTRHGTSFDWGNLLSIAIERLKKEFCNGMLLIL